jgi:hypothetical protein
MARSESLYRFGILHTSRRPHHTIDWPEFGPAHRKAQHRPAYTANDGNLGLSFPAHNGVGSGYRRPQKGQTQPEWLRGSAPIAKRTSIKRIIRVSWILIPRDLAAAGSDRQGQSLKQREVNMDVEKVGLKAGEAIRHRDSFFRGDHSRLFNSMTLFASC